MNKRLDRQRLPLAVLSGGTHGGAGGSQSRGPSLLLRGSAQNCYVGIAGTCR